MFGDVLLLRKYMLSGGVYPHPKSFSLKREKDFEIPYEQPLVVPQSSQTVHAPLRLTLIEPHAGHCSPV